MCVLRTGVLFVLFSWTLLAGGYELSTHGAITKFSFERSLLVSSSVFDVLGLMGGDRPFGFIYYDMNNFGVRSRNNWFFEDSIIRDKLFSEPLSAKGWLMRGAIREDDLPRPIGRNPQDDPDDSIVRVRNHFYDPVNRRPLEVAGVALGTDAPTWASGSEEAFGCPNCEDLERRNHFTVMDAREAMYRALTGQDRFGNTAIGPNGQQADESIRKAYWATTFRALGDILHLVQDMAQPQHTRNDIHTPTSSFGSRAYEAYTEARALGEKFKCAGGTAGSVLPPLVYDGYPVPSFSRYSEFFSTVPTDTNGDISTGRGLSDYSNRGFFTAGTNIGSNAYALPDQNPAVYTLTRSAIADPCIPAGIQAELLNGTVPDTVTGGNNTIPMSTRGLWSVPAFPGAWPAVDYSLSEEVFIAMADLLVPRAVAYSAGLLDYFFRGRLDVQVETYNRSEVVLKYRNLAKDDTLYSRNGGSQLVVTYRYKDNGQTIFGVSNTVSVASLDDVAPGAVSSQSYTFSFSPAIPQGAEALELRLVFRGKLGNEDDAVAVGMEPMTSPGFLVTPSVTPADGVAGPRHIYMTDGKWKLSPETGFQYGNVDWKGARGDVLTFDGPPSRYFFPETVVGYSRNIFRKGSMWAQIPRGQVSGVGIRQLQSERQLVAISFDRAGFDLRVYGRTFADSYPNDDDYNQVSNPLGWKLLYQADFGASGLAPSTPVFMNASGTEAQGVFGQWGTDQRFLKLIKVSLDGNSVSHTESAATGSYSRTRTTSKTTSRLFNVDLGQDNGDCTVTGQCTTWGTCDSSQTAFCIRTDFQYSWPQSLSLLDDTVQSTVSPTIALVDYIGDREVRAEIRHDRYRKKTSSELKISYESIYTNQSCDAISEGTTTRSVTRSSPAMLNDEIYLNTGLLDLTLSNTATSSTSDEAHAWNVDFLGGTLLHTGSYDSILSRDEVVSRIVAMDIRNEFVVYSESGAMSTTVNQASGVPCCIQGRQLTAGQTQSNTDVYRLMASVDGSKVELVSEQTSTSINDSFMRTLPDFTILGDCPDTSTLDTSNSWSYDDDASLAWGFVHPQAISGGRLQGAVIDQQGHALVSQTMWLEQADGSYKTEGVWNYLSNGNLSIVFGINDPQVSFWPVGLY